MFQDGEMEMQKMLKQTPLLIRMVDNCDDKQLDQHVSLCPTASALLVSLMSPGA